MARSGFSVGIEGPRLNAHERDFLAQARPWGVILFARNVETPDQLRALTDDLRGLLGDELPILVDQEGGRVQRLGAPHWRVWPAPLDHAAAAGAKAARAMYLRALLIGQELRAAGIDVNCAPTCDVAGPGTHPFLMNRCYGHDGETVARLARATAEGLMDAGILPVMKHMPGHGRGRVDSHLSLPATDAPRADLDAVDFAPFRVLADLPMGMTAHMRYDAIDDDPATHSAPVIEVIRGDIGFDGLLMSDDISMEALGGSLATRAARALHAGCDLVLHCNGDLDEGRVLAAELPAMTEAAERRSSAALAARRAPVDCDPLDAWAKLAALTPGLFHG